MNREGQGRPTVAEQQWADLTAAAIRGLFVAAVAAGDVEREALRRTRRTAARVLSETISELTGLRGLELAAYIRERATSLDPRYQCEQFKGPEDDCGQGVQHV